MPRLWCAFRAAGACAVDCHPPIVAKEAESFHKAVVEGGLRGQLLMESLVTGLLYIGLDLFPGTPINLVQKPNGNYKYPEIPTLPTTLEQAQDTATKVIAKLAEIDFKALMDSISGAVDGVNQLANSPALKGRCGIWNKPFSGWMRPWLIFANW